MKILITGPQGSGKSTQAVIIAKLYGLKFLGVGELLRQLSEIDNEEGRRVKEKLEVGNLVDDEIVARLVEKTVSHPDWQSGFVTDGYPRNLAQIKIFDPNFDRVIYLQMPDQAVIRRLIVRGREDDTPDAIAQRLKWYHQQTEQILDVYKKSGKLIVVSGDQPINKVTSDIETNLGGMVSGG